MHHRTLDRSARARGLTAVSVAAMVATSLALNTITGTFHGVRAEDQPGSAWTLETPQLSNPFPAVVTHKDTDPAGRRNRFGSALALAGDTLVVGVGEDQFNPSNGGSDPFAHPERVVVHERTATGWDGGTLLQAPEVNRPPVGCSPSTDDCFEFGRAVALDPVEADTIVVGAPAEVVVAGGTGHEKHGAAYVFERSGAGWSMVARLVSPNPQPNDRFGAAVAIHGDTIVVGVEGDRASGDATGPLNGAAYVFTRTGGTWATTPTATLRSPTNPVPSFASYGQAVAIWGDTIAVGDRGAGAADTQDQEVVHVHRRSGDSWPVEATVRGVFQQSRAALVLRGDVLVAGSEWIGGPSQGDAFVSTRSGTTWSTPVSLASVLPADVTKPAWFGGAAAIDGDLVAVGARTATGSGVVQLFELTEAGPEFIEQLEPPLASKGNLWGTTPYENGRRFGSSIALGGALLVAGSPWDCTLSDDLCDDEKRNQAGSVFTFVNPSRVAAEPDPGPEDVEGPVEGGTDAGADAAPAQTWIPTPAREQPLMQRTRGEMQREDGQPVQLAAMSTAAGEVAYVDDTGMMSIVFTGDPATSVARGLVATSDGMVRCEVCAALAEGTIVEVWGFSTPRLVAAAVADADGCIDVMIPLSAPLDGGPSFEAGEHTLQVVLPMDDGLGRLAVNVGVTMGGLAPGSLPAGEGTASGAGTAAATLAVTLGGLVLALRRRQSRGRQGAAVSA